MRSLFAALSILIFAGTAGAMSVTLPDKISLEAMTWQEVHDAVQAGKTTVIVPTGGTEQNGPAVVLGKHNYVLSFTAKEIATQLGNALVAPVMPYVPEGDITPPTGHMHFAGTLSLTPATFAAFLEDTARSLKQHGFKTICFVGEHGASQAVQKSVAEKLTAEWKKEGVHVIHVGDYYDEHNGHVQWAKKEYPLEGDIEAHGGFADASEMLVVKAEGVRTTLLAPHTPADMDKVGAGGSSQNANLTAGSELLRLKIAAAVKQIRASQP